MPLIMPVYGTRPEAVKMAPLVAALRETAELDVFISLTGQHREMLDQVNELFGIVGDHDLNILSPRQTLSAITAKTLGGLAELFETVKPDAVVVQGDTGTSTAAAMAAFYEQIPVVHLEAGLRSDTGIRPSGRDQSQDHHSDRIASSRANGVQPGESCA